MFNRTLDRRQFAECVEQFGADLKKLVAAFDKDVQRAGSHFDERVNAIPNQDELEAIARAFLQLGATLCDEDDAANEADDRRANNPLEPDYRRIG